MDRGDAAQLAAVVTPDLDCWIELSLLTGLRPKPCLSSGYPFLRPKKGRNKRENRAMAELDQAKVDAFTQAMTGILNGGTLALMTRALDTTGLFETLATLPPQPVGRLPMWRA
jgi:hypothetical protein